MKQIFRATKQNQAHSFIPDGDQSGIRVFLIRACPPQTPGVI